MDYVSLGKTGLKVSAHLRLGCTDLPEAAVKGELRPGSHRWSLNEEEAQPFLRRRPRSWNQFFFDTAKCVSPHSEKVKMSLGDS